MSRLGTDKRQRLVAAAIERFHESGFVRTSLAQVAERAGIAPGNVFYYFKTKDDLARAVVEEWRDRLTAHLAPLDALPDPWERLLAFCDQGAALAGMYVAQGCPLAGLTRDLRQENETLAAEAPRLYAVQFAWLARQFGSAGLSIAKADEHARLFMARYHGAVQLAYAQTDERQFTDELAELKRWLGAIGNSRTPK